MGAEYCTMRVKSQDKKIVLSQFKAEQESDRYENGHSYSGGFGMAPGLDFADYKTFDSYDEADQYLSETVQKWENALAVPYKDKDKVYFLIAAVCSS